VKVGRYAVPILGIRSSGDASLPTIRGEQLSALAAGTVAGGDVSPIA